MCIRKEIQRAKHTSLYMNKICHSQVLMTSLKKFSHKLNKELKICECFKGYKIHNLY